MKQTLFITGTDTGAGKTVLAALLTRFLRERGVNAAAFKPLCSGGRDDARTLRAAMNGALTLGQINPWHFRAPLAPLLAARRENKAVQLAQVLVRARALQKRFDVLLVEGAGGLLSPLGENFNSRDLILALRATPVIVAPNRLGTVNHVLLTVEALPKNVRARTCVVLVTPPEPDAAARSNASLLAERVNVSVHLLPWLDTPAPASPRPAVRKALQSLVGCLLNSSAGR
jgi:dethiobiotin synthetase